MICGDSRSDLEFGFEQKKKAVSGLLGDVWPDTV